jgi:hypothetical protein
MNRIRIAATFLCCLGFAGPSMAQTVGSITSIIEPMTRQVVQRRDDNIGNVLVIGTYTGNVTSFQARSLLRPGMTGTPIGWTFLEDVTIFEGYFVGIFRQPAGGFYDLQVRPLFGGQLGQPVDIFAVGVGEVFITAGQSNATNWGTPTGFVPDLRVSCFYDGPYSGTNTAYPGAAWIWGIDPMPALDNSTLGSPWPIMATNLVEALGVPVGLYMAGFVGSSIENWQPGYVLFPGTATTLPVELFGRLTNAIEYFNGRGGVRAVLWIQGETDYLEALLPSVYQANLAFVIEQSRLVTGVPIKWMVAQTTTPLNSYPAEKLGLEQAQAAVVDDVLTFPGPNADLIGLPYRAYQNNLPVHFNAAGLSLLGGYWGIYVANLPGFLAPGFLP